MVHVHRIDVGWGDCDPAQIAYTGRLPDFAVRAVEGWWIRHHAGWLDMHRAGLGTPFVSISIDFRAPVRPGVLECHVGPERLGSRSVSFRVEGRQEGGLCFETSLTCAFVDPERFVSRAAPDEIRALIGAHLP